MSDNRRQLHLSIAALGIVYGDIGTSPIYALRECFLGAHAVAPTPENILGVLSLIVWSLVLVVSVKYLMFIMQADNKGEGGIVALIALLIPWRRKRDSTRHVLMLLGLLGAAFLFADGAITPAISVLSAVEGLNVATPAFEPFVLPITLAILIGVFVIQRRGTAGIGAVFGPVIAVWFVVIGLLGARAIFAHPEVLAALSPTHALSFMLNHGFRGFAMLGSVFLVVTGAEALYADMGHFGRAPIRRAWFFLVSPGLLLNYLGQGALILGAPVHVEAPFYHLAPGWMIYPLVVLTTMATIIASQAMISGAFSLAHQLVHMGQLPRLNIIQTSSDQQGQIYVPFVNWALMLATLALVLGFGSSGALASIYGIAVSSTMVITTILAFFVARRFGWKLIYAGGLGALFLCMDLGFFGANALKLGSGGWYPLLGALVLFTLMTTWGRGREILRRRLAKFSVPIDQFLKELREHPPHRIPGTGVFLTREDQAPARLVHYTRRNRIMHEHVVLFTVETEDEPRVEEAGRLQSERISPFLSRVRLHCGFMEDADIPAALATCRRQGLPIDLDHLTYYLGRETLIPEPDDDGMALWREHLFAFLSRNALRAEAFYRLPPEDVIEVGFQVRNLARL